MKNLIIDLQGNGGGFLNEAVEIAKGYDPAEVVSFINGILGSFARAQAKKEEE